MPLPRALIALIMSYGNNLLPRAGSRGRHTWWPWQQPARLGSERVPSAHARAILRSYAPRGPRRQEKRLRSASLTQKGAEWCALCALRRIIGRSIISLLLWTTRGKQIYQLRRLF